MDSQQQRNHPRNRPSAHPAELQQIPNPTLGNQATCNNTAPLQVTATTSSATASFVPSLDRSTTVSQDSFEGGSGSSDGANAQVIREEVSQLQEQFVTVLTHTKKFLFQKKTFWGGFKFRLTQLPLSKGCPHFLKKEQDDIMKAVDTDEICNILKPYWNYIDYALLKHLIKMFATEELKEEMVRYIAELELFEKKTSVQDFDSAFQDNRVLPAYFKTVTITQAKDPAEYSLHDARQLRNEVVNRSTLQEYTVYLQGVRCNSVEIILAYPPDAHTELMAVFNEEFMETHNIAFGCGATPTKQKQVKWDRLGRGNSAPRSPETPPQHSSPSKGTV